MSFQNATISTFTIYSKFSFLSQIINMIKVICFLAFFVSFAQSLCSLNCQNCTSPTSCAGCNSNFYLDGQICRSCGIGCLTCTSPTECTSCSLGYILLDNNCKACSYGCDICNQNKTCTTCAQGYIDFGTTQCASCPQGCRSCVWISSRMSCEVCHLGWILVSAPEGRSACQSCSYGCLNCTNTTVCLTCMSGFYLENNECVACSSQCANCTNSSFCFECNPFYYANNGVCEECNYQNLNCHICSSYNICTKCYPRYYVDSNSSCKRCPENCMTCFDSNTCITCYDGKYFSNGRCLDCPAGCVECNHPSYCISCDTNYEMVLPYICTPVSQDCSYYVYDAMMNRVCEYCASPKVLENGKCYECHPLCLTCQISHRNCTSCRAPLILSNGSCIENNSCVVENCLTCDGNGACQTCISGFFLFNYECVQCMKSCNACNTFYTTNQIWQSISIHLNNYLLRAYNLQAGATPQQIQAVVPSIANGLDFQNMNQTLKKGWTEAYLYIDIIKNYYPTESEFISTIPGHISFYLQNQNKSWEQLQPLIISKFTQATNETWTVTGFRNKIKDNKISYSSCSECKNQYSRSNFGFCFKCPFGCSTCNYQYVCNSCIDGFYLFNGTCRFCPAKCKTCRLETSTQQPACYSCEYPYVFSLMDNTGVICALCAYPCKYCMNANLTHCLTCLKPFMQNSDNGKCVICQQPNCEACDFVNLSACLTCRDGYFPINTICQPCPANCSKCILYQNSSVCHKCNQGYELTGLADNFTCRICSSNCLKCADGSCIQCRPGTYLNKSTGRCIICPRGCIECVNATKCSKYQENVVIVEDTLRTCKPGTRALLDLPDCYYPEERFYIINQTSYFCPSGCSFCYSDYDYLNPQITPNVICMTCQKGYMLVNQTCVSCSSNCLSCTNTSSCQLCKIGYYLSPSKICVQYTCSDGCSACDTINSSICLKCKPGYTLAASGTCLKCLGSCSGSCDPKNISVCVSCIKGFQLINYRCVQCSAGCSSCLYSECSSCFDGYQLQQAQNGTFYCKQKCIPPCLQCMQGVCTACEFGTNLVNGKCEPDFSCTPSNCGFCPYGASRKLIANQPGCVRCGTNCSSCTELNPCTQCYPGFYLNNSECLPCPPQCKTCYNNNTCRECSSGYVREIILIDEAYNSTTLYSDVCVPCIANCKTCVVWPSICSSCQNGLKLDGHRCVGQYTVNYQYELSVSYTTFLNNYQSESFVDTISTLAGVSSENNTIVYIREGSTIIGGSISTQGIAQASAVQASLGSSVPGFTVLSSSAQIYNGNSVYGNSNNGLSPSDSSSKQKQGSTNVSLIIGLCVGLSVLVAFVVILVYIIKYRQRLRQQKQVDPIKQEESSYIEKDK